MAKISVSAKRVLAIALVGSGLLTLLFWAKLRLMTQVPRAAYAEPDSAVPTDQPSAVHDDKARDGASAQPRDRERDRDDSPELVDTEDAGS